MLKQTILMLLMATMIFFSACAERGYNLKSVQNQQTLAEKVKSSLHFEKNSLHNTSKVEDKIENERFLKISDETKNTISGFFIIIIGIIILL